jgi:hypothetical protein
MGVSVGTGVVVAVGIGVSVGSEVSVGERSVEAAGSTVGVGTHAESMHRIRMIQKIRVFI